MLSTFYIVMATLSVLGCTSISLKYLFAKQIPNYEKARHLIQLVANILFLGFRLYDYLTPVPSMELDWSGFYFRAMIVVFMNTAWAASATITYIPALLELFWGKTFVYVNDSTAELEQGE